MRLLAPLLASSLMLRVVPAPAQTGDPVQAAPSSQPAASASVPAERPAGKWRVLVAPYTLHFSYDDAHKPVLLLGLEHERADGIVWGGAVFDNSFGQPSAYVFGGQRLYNWSRFPLLYAEWSAGLLYGYTGQYQHKVPLNYKGFAPGIVVGLGWQFTPVLAGQLNLLGNSGLMLHFSVDLP
jgi:hypothetical protein